MSRILKSVFIVLMISSVIYGENQITVFDNSGFLKLEQYNLKVNRFVFPETQKELNSENKLRICESLDNSLFVWVGSHISSKDLGLLFNNTEIVNSLSELLNRKGIIYFAPSEWKIISLVPSSMNRWLKSIHIDQAWQAAYYKNTSENKKEIKVKALLTKEFENSIFNTPHKNISTLAVRHFGDITKKTNLKALMQTPDGKFTTMVVGEIPGKGRVIFSNAYDIDRATTSPFLENILTGLYDNFRKLSSRQRLSGEGSIQKPACFIDLNKIATYSLVSIKKSEKLVNLTTVTVRCDKKKLYVTFQCKAQMPLLTKYSERDSAIWNDDCVEVFIADSVKSSSNMYHFILNSNNIVYDEKNLSRSWNAKKLTTAVKKSKDGFEAFFEIGLAELGLKDSFKINLCRESYNPEELSALLPTNAFFSKKNMAVASFLPEASFLTKKAVPQVLSIVQEPVFKRIYEDSEPEDDAVNVTNIDMLLARKDRELAKIVFYNRTGSHCYFRIEENQVNSDIFKIKELLPWRAPNGEVFFEIESELNEANVVCVPDGGNCVLLIEAYTDKTPANYTWDFELVPVTSDKKKCKIKVNAEVLNLEVSETMPDVYTFGPYGKRGKKYNEFLKKNLINIVIGEINIRKVIKKDAAGKIILSENKKDYLTDEAEMAKLGVKWSYGYGIWAEFCHRVGAKQNETTPETNQMFEEYVKRWASALHEANVDFSSFTVPLQDEPRSEDLDGLILAAKIFHKYGFQTNLTIATWSTLDDVEKISPYIDLMMPTETRIVSRKTANDELKIYRKYCKRIMPYLCSTSSCYSNYMHYFRYRGIRSYQLGFYGFAMWAANSWRGNDYHSVEDSKSNGSWLFHHNNVNPVGTLRLEAFREGIEDLYYLKRASLSDKSEVKELISKENLQAILQDGSSVQVKKWRDKLLRTLAD